MLTFLRNNSLSCDFPLQVICQFRIFTVVDSFESKTLSTQVEECVFEEMSKDKEISDVQHLIIMIINSNFCESYIVGAVLEIFLLVLSQPPGPTELSH